MNGNRNTGTKMAQWINSVNIPIQVNISTLGTKTFKWTYEGRELLDFIHKVRISPTEALHTVIEVWIKLANLSLPLFADDINVQSISNNAIAKSMSPNERLIRILQKNDNIIFVSEIKEKDFHSMKFGQMPQIQYLLMLLQKKYQKMPMFVNSLI